MCSRPLLLFRLCSVDLIEKLRAGKRRAVGNHRAFTKTDLHAADHLLDLIGKAVLRHLIPEMFQKLTFFSIEEGL